MSVQPRIFLKLKENFSQIVLWSWTVKTLVMSEFKNCKNLARILKDINQGKKRNQGTIVIENTFEENYSLLNKLQNELN